MHYTKIIFFFALLSVVSCGKPPFLNKIKKQFSEISGNNSISENFPNQNITFSYQWITPPSLDNLSSLELSLSKPLTQNQSLHAYVWMPEMGHGSSPIEITSLNSTDYSLGEIAFIMPGLWELHIEILENNRIIDQWQKSYSL